MNSIFTKEAVLYRQIKNAIAFTEEAAFTELPAWNHFLREKS